MSSLFDILSNHLDREQISTLSKTIDAEPEQTESALATILPTLVSGLARNANQPDGQQRLANALERDHDGSMLDHLGALLQGEPERAPVPDKAAAGGSILDHILGGRRERVATGVEQSSGLSRGQVMKLMAIAAPLVMAALGRRKKQEQLSAEDLGRVLQSEQQQVDTSPGGGLLARMFDQDGDGDFDMMDIMRFGAGRLFRRG